MDENPYKAPLPDAPAQVPQAPVRQIPMWVMRAFFAVTGVILLVDALTRYRPAIRPAWLGLITTPNQALVVLVLLFIA